MSADNRTVATDAVATIGMLIPENAGRDAIHLAVEPVVAGERLYAGQHIGFLPDGRVGTTAENLIGIVDPFLTSVVFPDSRIWLVVYPRTITSLRHVWEHPAFAPVSITLAPQDAAPSSKSASKEWMTAWAVRHMGVDYYGDDQVSPESSFETAIEAGRSMSVGPFESARDYIDGEWWAHWEAITGEKGSRDEYFSCAC